MTASAGGTMSLGAATLSEASDGIIAQYLTTKITWWGAYRRILTVSSSHIATFNPEDFACTNEWFLGDISHIELAPDPEQFILVLEKSRFRSIKVRFQCHARSHFLALVDKLRRHYMFQPLRLRDADGRRQHYQCTEHYGDDSYDHFLLQVGHSGITLLDEHGRKVSQFPFVYLQRVAASTAHPDGLVLSTMFQERLFLCHPRNECLEHIRAAARALGVNLVVEESPLNMQLLRLRNSQMLDSPSAVSFEVQMAVDDGKIVKSIQLIFQGAAMLEVHRKLRTVIHRPYATLLNIVHSDWDAETVVLQFIHSENLVIRLESRDQFIAILLLVCREAGNEHVEVSPSTIKKNRMYHPHATENIRETAGTAMETFFLRRIVHAQLRDDDDYGGAIGESTFRGSGQHSDSWRARRRERRRRQRMMDARMSMDTGVSLNDHISLALAMEEFIANIPLGGLSDHCNRQLLNKALRALIEHLLSLVTSLRQYADSTTVDIILTLQALSRLAQSPHAYFPEDLVPRLFDALHELILRQHFLTGYWCLKLLQSYFEPRKSELARTHRAKALQNFVENKLLMFSILDLVPATSALSANSSGRWVRHGANPTNPNDADQPLNQTLLFTKEERLEKDMNILTYEALFTLHHVLIYLHAKEKLESESAMSSLARSRQEAAAGTDNHKGGKKHRRKTNDWARTLEFEDENDEFAIHQFNYNLAAHAKMEIGEKLLEKYQFLMDAVVDIRLARACQTLVALITFLVNYFDKDKGSHAHTSGRRKLLEMAPKLDSESSEVDTDRGRRMGDHPMYRRQRDSSPMRRSSLDDEAEERMNTEKQRIVNHKVDELNAFLECYQADVASLNERSRLFQVQQTILVPLLGFSQATSTDSNGQSFFNVSGMMASNADNLKLEHLDLNEDDEKDEPSTQDGKPRRASITTTTTTTTKRNSRPNPTPRKHRSERKFDLSDIRSESPMSIARLRSESNFVRLPKYTSERDFDGRRNDNNDTLIDLNFGFTVGVREKKIHDRELRRTRAQSISEDRVSAHNCDACICCNDVCQNDGCFFCAEKEYQLRLAFATSSLRRSTGLSLSNVERKYSSCEVKRHQHKRSCWVVVDGIVYDVTDLLGVHPGGMHALLSAAKDGFDCADILQDHPPTAMRILEHYRLGEFYKCEKRTLLH